MAGLQTAEEEGWLETSMEPAVGLTPDELHERQEQRGRLALLHANREREVKQESAALVREKRAYARALGKAASRQAIEQLQVERSTAPLYSMMRSSSTGMLRSGSSMRAAAARSPRGGMRGGGSLRPWKGAEEAEDGESSVSDGDGANASLAHPPPRWAQPLAPGELPLEEPLMRNAAQAGGDGSAAPSADAAGAAERAVAMQTWRLDPTGAEEGGRQPRAPLRSCGDAALNGGCHRAGMQGSVASEGAYVGSGRQSASSEGWHTSRLSTLGEFERLYRGEPLGGSAPPRGQQLQVALERGRAAKARITRLAQAEQSRQEEARRRKEHARVLGGAASLFAIEQLRQSAAGRRTPSPARQRHEAATEKKTAAVAGTTTSAATDAPSAWGGEDGTDDESTAGADGPTEGDDAAAGATSRAPSSPAPSSPPPLLHSSTPPLLHSSSSPPRPPLLALLPRALLSSSSPPCPNTD